MSAFIVSDLHISVLAREIKTRLMSGLTITIQDIGDILTRQNYISFNARYPDNPEPPQPFTFIEHKPTSCAQVMNCAECYDYQSSETDDYEQTLPAVLIRRLKDDLLKSMVLSSIERFYAYRDANLPGLFWDLQEEMVCPECGAWLWHSQSAFYEALQTDVCWQCPECKQYTDNPNFATGNIELETSTHESGGISLS